LKKTRMILRSAVRDCLTLNWAFPRQAMPDLPKPLRYEQYRWSGEEWVFGSAHMFHNERLRLASVPFLRLSYPQFQFRLHVRDADDLPSFLAHSTMVPAWVLPTTLLVGGRRVPPAGFRFPRPSRTPDLLAWEWAVRNTGGEQLAVSAIAGTPDRGPGPGLGSWERIVRHFHKPTRAYTQTSHGLQRTDISRHQTAVWPMRVTIGQGGLLGACLPLVGRAQWPELHSAWLCPETSIVIEREPVAEAASLPRSSGPVVTDPAVFDGREGGNSESSPDPISVLPSAA